MISDEQIAKWREQMAQSHVMISSLDEYVPREFEELLDEYEKLRKLMMSLGNLEQVKKIRDKMASENPDSMIATGDDLVWLINQLANWPTRVDQQKTTNLRFLMQSAARTMVRMEEMKREE